MTRLLFTFLFLSAASASAQDLRNTEIAKALMALRPGEQWTQSGDDCAKLQWHAKTKPPTCAEIDAEIARQRKAPPPTRIQQALERLQALGLTPDDLKELLK